MLKHYADYVWSNGKPYGLQPNEEATAAINFRIVADPYYKRITVEKYLGWSFKEVVYDSALLDFRHLKPIAQNAWQKETIQQNSQEVVAIIRNQDDRAIYIETCVFHQNRCISCHVKTTHGIAVSEHKMYYKDLGDPINGVILYDNGKKPVMYKLYEVDSLSGEFTDLLHEEWCLDRNKLPF